MAQQPDWHIEDIKSSIRKTGLSCEGLAVSCGYERSAVRIALRRSWPAVQAIIARHLQLRPWDIWPSRYDESGNPLRGKAVRRGTAIPSPAPSGPHRKIGEAA